jgi:regulator of replication initiation timing
MRNKVKFGYEIGTGEVVEIPQSHTVITGLTNESGKTTALIGIGKRSGLKIIIFKTKIGEKAISEGSIIPPFYKESFDWEYAAELLEASRKEKLKFERSWIIKYSKGANNLLEFKRNIDNALSEGKLRELDKSVLVTLQAYLDKILPELQYAPLSHTLDIKEGINIMDLERFKEETQGIIIKSVLEEVLKREKNVMIFIPECWKYLPEKLGNPVKRPAEEFIRQGATNSNFLVLDSQDITGVSKSILKQVSNWILGYQREKNEIERTLDQIPLSNKSKPKSEEIATLKLGEFFVATSEGVKKCYAQPIWLDDEKAKDVALGNLKVEDLEQPVHLAPYAIENGPGGNGGYEPRGMTIEVYPDKKLNELREDFIIFKNDMFTKFQQLNETISTIYQEIYKIKNEKQNISEDEIVMRVLQKIPINKSNSNPVIDEEALIRKVISRVPRSGNVVYEVSPLEKIKKDFLQEAKDKILDDISKLGDDAKRMLKYLESKGKGAKTNELVTMCYLTKDGGSQRTKVANAGKELENAEVLKKDTAGFYRAVLKDRITLLMGNHEASPQEIQSVYDHIIMELLK